METEKKGSGRSETSPDGSRVRAEPFLQKSTQTLPTKTAIGFTAPGCRRRETALGSRRKSKRYTGLSVDRGSSFQEEMKKNCLERAPPYRSLLLLPGDAREEESGGPPSLFDEANSDWETPARERSGGEGKKLFRSELYQQSAFFLFLGALAAFRSPIDPVSRTCC